MWLGCEWRRARIWEFGDFEKAVCWDLTLGRANPAGENCVSLSSCWITESRQCFGISLHRYICIVVLRLFSTYIYQRWQIFVRDCPSITHIMILVFWTQHSLSQGQKLRAFRRVLTDSHAVLSLSPIGLLRFTATWDEPVFLSLGLWRWMPTGDKHFFLWAWVSIRGFSPI